MASWGPSARDRSQEFASLVEMYNAKRVAPVRAPLPPVQQPAPVPMSQFSEAAKGINAGITSVATKLHDLTKLAKGATLFNDNSSAISELTTVCKQDLLILNGEVEALERWVENGGSHDSSFGQSKSHSQQVVFNLKTQLGQQARSFAHLLTLRTKSMKDQSNRRKQFVSGSSLPLRKRPALGADTAIEYDPSDPNAPSMPATSGMQYQVMVDDQQGEQYVASRAQAVMEIESTIQELATMYQRLAILVKQQEEQAVRLDMTVEETLEHTQSAHQQLTKYYEWVQGNRWLMLKVFAALIFFAFIFVAFIQ